ncbi:MAG: 50S ribosomal protein L1 [Leptonema sp. (in: bacteria)]
MKHRGKKWIEANKKINSNEFTNMEEAVKKIKELSYTKFDGTVEAHFKINYKSPQNVRGIVFLPYGTGKKVKVLVIAKEDKHQIAKDAGADFVGSDDIIEKIQNEKWTDFDVCIATPDMMGKIGKLGPILKGKMPKPKAGTVTDDLATAIKNVKKGQFEYKSDKTGVIHVPIGKVSFDSEQLKENLKTLFHSILKDKPSDAKGEYIKTVYIAPTMGPSIKINPRTIL